MRVRLPRHPKPREPRPVEDWADPVQYFKALVDYHVDLFVWHSRRMARWVMTAGVLAVIAAVLVLVSQVLR